MRLFYTFIILILFQNCSFDNKTGIWNNENIITTNKDTDLFKEFKKLCRSYGKPKSNCIKTVLNFKRAKICLLNCYVFKPVKTF